MTQSEISLADLGAVSGSRREKDFNLPIALAVSALLRDAGHGVITDRTSDRDSKLADKIKQANDNKVDAVVEIHLNAGGGTGCEAYHSKNGGQGQKLGTNICAEIARLGYRNRGPKIKLDKLGRDYFGIIRNTKAPATLVECCFLDNDADMAAYNLQRMAQAIAAGILSLYPAAKKAPPAAAQKPTAKPAELKVGSVVNFKGGKHYSSSGSALAVGGKRTAGTAKITNINLKGKHPYHLFGIKSNVYGWVNKSDIG